MTTITNATKISGRYALKLPDTQRPRSWLSRSKRPYPVRTTARNPPSAGPIRRATEGVRSNTDGVSYGAEGVEMTSLADEREAHGPHEQ
jgi:hypothetical protein